MNAYRLFVTFCSLHHYSIYHIIATIYHFTFLYLPEILTTSRIRSMNKPLCKTIIWFLVLFKIGLFKRGRSGGLVFPPLKEFSTVCWKYVSHLLLFPCRALSWRFCKIICFRSVVTWLSHVVFCRWWAEAVPSYLKFYQGCMLHAACMLSCSGMSDSLRPHGL